MSHNTVRQLYSLEGKVVIAVMANVTLVLHLLARLPAASSQRPLDERNIPRTDPGVPSCVRHQNETKKALVTLFE